MTCTKYQSPTRGEGKRNGVERLLDGGSDARSRAEPLHVFAAPLTPQVIVPVVRGDGRRRAVPAEQSAAVEVATGGGNLTRNKPLPGVTGNL